MAGFRTRDYDVIVVGARCAGATLAAFLARAGADVLLLDRDAMPSDQVLSTHNIHAAGMEVLDDLEVGEDIRSVVRPTSVIRLDLDGFQVDVEPPGPAYCPRRMRLDGVLQRAARAAGAVMLDQTRVVSLISEGGRVCGVRATISGEDRVVRGNLVVGADGRHSTVALHTGAEEYLAYDAPRAVFWGYWRAPNVWFTDHRFDMYFGMRDGWITAIFQTDHDHLLMACSPPADQVEAGRNDPPGFLQSALLADPVARPLVKAASPIDKIRGAVKERYFFRRAVGEGWALVGDAGIHKEFLLGDGITDALLQARSLAAAIGENSQGALHRWWRARDVDTLPLYSLGQEIARPDPPLELMRYAFSRLEANPELTTQVDAVMARKLSPFAMIPASELAGLAAHAVLEQRWGVLRELINVTGRVATMNRELHARQRLLAVATAAAPPPKPLLTPWREQDSEEAAAA